MTLTIKDYNYNNIYGADIVELIVESGNTKLTEDVTDVRGFVDQELIDSLRSIADELEQQNLLRANKFKLESMEEV